MLARPSRPPLPSSSPPATAPPVPDAGAAPSAPRQSDRPPRGRSGALALHALNLAALLSQGRGIRENLGKLAERLRDWTPKDADADAVEGAHEDQASEARRPARRGRRSNWATGWK